MAKCGQCDADVEMHKSRFEWKTADGKLMVLRGFMGTCETCGANSIDPETMEQMENHGIVTRGVTQ